MESSKTRSFLRLAIVAWGCSCIPSAASAYQVSCSTNSTGGPNPFNATEITSTFAEPRGAADGQKGTPDRFHSGTDIKDYCLEDRWVYPIEDGTVSISGATGCTNTPGQIRCIRVIGNSGRVFEYVHVDYTAVSPALSDGSPVTTSSKIGRIQPPGGLTLGNHLHLIHVITAGGFGNSRNYRVNAQAPLRLAFTDSDVPSFSTATIGAVVDKEIIVAKGGIRPPQPFIVRSNTAYVKGDADVFVTASVKRSGNQQRKGLYNIGTNAIPIRSTAFGTSSLANQMSFNTLPDGGVAAGQVQVIYYEQQVVANTSIPTSIFAGPSMSAPSMPVTQTGTWATGSYSDGAFNLCATIRHYPNGPTASNCANVYVDNTNPSLTMSNSGGTIENGGATSTTTITIAATDAGGIYTIKVEKTDVSYSSTNYVSGVQTSASKAASRKLWKLA